MSSMPQQNDVLYLVVQYLQAKGFYTSSLTLQQESGLDVTWLRGYSREVALLRRWVFAGDVKRARALLQPLASLSDVSEEMKAALLGLDELEVMMKTQTLELSRVANAKLKCFKSLVTLFRAPVGTDETNVFKYVAMPKLQLSALIHDAVLFHRQTGDGTAQDCISVTCSVREEDAAEEEDEKVLLRLDEPLSRIPTQEYDIIPSKVESVAHSVEWMSRQSKQRNPNASSINLSKHLWSDELGGLEESFPIQNVKETVDTAVNCDVDVMETADATVSCDLAVKETIDAAVSCELNVKETADASVSCKPEEKKTADVGVGCGCDEWSDVAIQTESFQHINEKGEECEPKDCNAEVREQQQENSNSDFREEPKVQTKPIDSFHPGQEENQNDQEQTVVLANSTSNKYLTASWARKSSHDPVMNSLYTTGAGPEVDQAEMVIEDASPLEERESVELQEDFDGKMINGSEMPLSRGPPQHYDELKLDHVVCASVIAEVKEPQAVRALDVHPNGTQLAVGTNARALRVFDLLTPLHHRQKQLSWTPPLNSILPLLPVVLERHKHHDSGIYCVSYNQYLPHQSGAVSMIASGAADGSVKVLVTRNNDSIQRQQADELWIQQGDINGSMGKTRALEFASPHLLWVTSTNDRRLHCWDVRRTQRNSTSAAFQTLDGHVGEIQAMAMPHQSASRSASTLLLSAALDKTVRLWDTRSRRCERLVTSGAHPAFSLHFHPTNDRLVVSGHQDGNVALWDLRSTAREALQVVVPHQDECRSVRWSPGGQWLLSAAFDGTLCIMQATSSTLEPVASYHKHYGKVLQAQWHPTELAFVSSGADKRVKLWAFA